MKKIVLTTMALAAVGLSAHAQGSLSGLETVFSTDGITFGLNQTSASSASQYFAGNVDIEILYSATATAGTVTALNALDGTAAGGTALGVATGSDGFVVDSTLTTANGSPTGFIEGKNASTTVAVSSSSSLNDGVASEIPNIIQLAGSQTSGVLAMYMIAVGGPEAGDAGLIAWTQSSIGGNLNGSPPGTPLAIKQDPAGENLDLVPTPEPTTLAFAGLGGLSMLLLRRRNS